MPNAAAVPPLAAGDVASLLAWGTASLATSPSASLDAQLLLADVLARRRSWVIAHGDEPVSQSDVQRYARLIERRARREPLAYLRGYVEWLGMMLRISPDVLVPRPETELLAEEAIRIARERRLTACADIGTGSGCIAIALARALPEARVQATDISPAALEVARMNAAALGVSERISLGPGPLLAPLTREPQLITANLPYLSDEMMRHLPQDVRHEPVLALHGGRDGLELYAGLVDEMHERRWRPALLLEIDPRQAGTALRLLRDRGLRDVRILGDYAGLDRIIVVDA